MVVFIIEGNLKDAKFPQESLLGALVSAELVDNTHVFRTWSGMGATTTHAETTGRRRQSGPLGGGSAFPRSLEETAHLLKHLVEKMPALCHEPTDTLATNKRKKDSAPENIWSRERDSPK